MKYMDGTEAMAGDVVDLVPGNGPPTLGVVVQIVLPGTEDAITWSAPLGGVLIDSESHGIWMVSSLEDDEDVVFVRRRG